MTDMIIPRGKVNLEQLGLINQGLFPVNGELARRYNQVLEQVFGWKSELESFRVDKRGLSPELVVALKKKYPDHAMLEFGDNYLNLRSANRFMMVVSPDQKDAPLILPQTSYEDGFYDEVYRQARHTIEDITHSEVLFGELENGISVFKKVGDLLQLRTVEINPDTLNGTLEHYFGLKKMMDELNLDRAIDEDYIGQARELVRAVGGVANRAISKVFPITKEVHCFYVEFFRGAHCIRNFKNRDDIKTLFVYHDQRKPEHMGPEVLAIDIHDERLLDILHRHKILQYNIELLPQRLGEIEDELLLAKGIELADMTEVQRKREVVTHSRELPEYYHELRSITGLILNTTTKIEKVVPEMSYEARLKLSEAASKPEIVNHMLAELDPSDVDRLYQSSRRKFVTEFPELMVNRQRYIANLLLNKKQEVKK